MLQVNSTEAVKEWEKKYDAPKGYIWMCQACGKQSFNRVNGTRRWDESCFMNAKLKRIDDNVQSDLPAG